MPKLKKHTSNKNMKSYLKSLKVVDSIMATYGTEEALRKERDLFRQTKLPVFSDAFNKYQKFLYHRNNIEKIKREQNSDARKEREHPQCNDKPATASKAVISSKSNATSVYTYASAVRSNIPSSSKATASVSFKSNSFTVSATATSNDNFANASIDASSNDQDANINATATDTTANVNININTATNVNVDNKTDSFNINANANSSHSPNTNVNANVTINMTDDANFNNDSFVGHEASNDLVDTDEEEDVEQSQFESVDVLDYTDEEDEVEEEEEQEEQEEHGQINDADESTFLFGCANCRRKQSRVYVNEDGIDSRYTIHFTMYQTNQIKQKRRFKFCQSHRTETNACNIILCDECSVHLTHDDTAIANQSKFSWPGFIWSVLENKEIHKTYGNYVWKFIPIQWRYWWLSSLHQTFPIIFEDASITSPKSVFVDLSSDIDEWNQNISSFLLARLANTTNKHLMPKVLCPWGCSEYIHK